MPRAEHSIEIDVPAEVFYELITDFERYPSFLDSVQETRIVSSEDDQWEVELTIHVLRRIQYRLQLTGTPYEKVVWTLAEPGLFLKNDGGWRLESLSGDRIRAHYWIDVDVSAFVPKAITNRLVERNLPEMLEQWKTRAESAKERT